MTPDDSDVTKTILGGVSAALMAVATWAWNHTHGRIKDAEKSAKEEADRIMEQTITRMEFEAHVKADETQLGAIGAEMTTQRGNIAKLFDKLDEFGDKTEVKFTVLERIGTERHLELLAAIREAVKESRR